MKASRSWLVLAGLVILAVAPSARAQRRPYIGYTYPAGGQQATTFQIKLGGQDLDGVDAVVVSGSGVTGRVVDYQRRLNNQEIQLLREQLKILKQTKAPSGAAGDMMMADAAMLSAMAADKVSPGAAKGAPSADREAPRLIATLEQRTREWVQTPACASISSLVIVEVTISPEAEPGARELRVATPRGVSNPLVFQVGQLFEHARKPMITATIQVLGKEVTALRNRPASEMERRISIPCTVNGQIAAREVNRYRFEARKGQRLVISTQARQLIPYVADAVPGWFQPVILLYDAQGRELAFADDYRFKPDPVILYQATYDGEYVVEIHDSLYRGREDFVYRISIGELPFVTSIFPLGRSESSAVQPKPSGWNLENTVLTALTRDAAPGQHALTATRPGFASGPVPFVVDSLPECVDQEANDSVAAAQNIALPIAVNGRVDRADDWDVFQFEGRAGDTITAEVLARRLDSPLDAVLKLTDGAGKLLAFSDDREDLTAGVNTHHADSYLTAKLPADGTYYVHLGDTARKGGQEYGYRLRLSAPQPDFELRVVPSSVSAAINAGAPISVYAVRKDGFTGPIKLAMEDPSSAVSFAPVTLGPNQNVARLTIKGGATRTETPVAISIVGSAKIGPTEVLREAVPAEDRMQAFLWRHLVPASDLQVMVFDPRYQPPAKRVPPPRPVVAATPPVASNVAAEAAQPGAVTASSLPASKPKFTKQQIAGRLRQLKLLYEEGLLTDEFYEEKVAECDDVQ